MKRKISLLLAALFVLSLLPANIFAASTNSFSKSPTVVPENTLMAESTAKYIQTEYHVNPDGTRTEVAFRGTTPISATAIGKHKSVSVSGHSDIDYLIDGTDLKIELKDVIRKGEVFKVELDNASWLFRNAKTAPVASSGSLTNYSYPVATEHYATPISNRESTVGTTEIDYELYATYDTDRGIWRTGGIGSDTGTYQRYGSDKFGKPFRNGAGTLSSLLTQGVTDDGYHSATSYEVPYELTTSGWNSSYATITMGADFDPSIHLTSPTDRAYIIIPLVIRTTAAADVKVKIDGALTSVTSGTYIFGVSSGTLTNSYVKDPHTARDEFPLDLLVVRETRINSIDNGFFEIKAPSGFTFADPSTARVGVERGLTWASTGSDGWGTKGRNFDINWRVLGYYGNYYDESTLEVEIKDVVKSSTVTGSLYIDGLKLIADENAPYGDFAISLRNIRNTTVLSNQTNVKAGTRTEWTISLTTEGTIPDLVNGRYVRENMIEADDAYHKTAKVVFKENSIAAWWAGRQTVFTLPDGVKFRKVRITDVDNVADAYSKSLKDTDWYGTGENGVYLNDGIRHGYVTVEGGTMTWNGMQVSTGERAQVKMDIWVSIASGFDEDVTIGVSGTAIPEQPGEVSRVTIAKQISPVTVNTSVTDVKVGYQYQKTADIEITETKAGALLRGKQVRVSVSDMISEDMLITPDTKYQITDGDLKIRDFTTGMSGTAGGSYAYAPSATAASMHYYDTGLSQYYSSNYATLGQGGTIMFTIDKPSTKAATIKLTNVAVKVSRSVPVTNLQPYNVVVWGTAIAENYGSRRDQFQKPGVTAPYIQNISSAEDQTSLLSQEVRVVIGESYYTANGKMVDMDAAAYISPTSNSTMVPIRFIANAFGLRDDQIVWDGLNKTASIIHPTKVLQFTAGSDVMVVNGMSITMYSPDRLPVQAEIHGESGHERMYIPFRALGEAFGIPVTWDADTQTAVYNEGANTDRAAAQTTVE